MRCGNSFEMATLLCSLLIANRYGAMVVSGYASREVTNQNQQRVICPNIPIRSSKQPKKVTNLLVFFDIIYFDFLCSFSYKKPETTRKSDETMITNKYSLRDPIDLRSQFLLKMEARKLQKANDQDLQKMERQLEELRILEEMPDDEQKGNRRHAWVVILSNVEWAAKISAEPSHGFDENTPTQPFFIEPSTGFHFSADDPNYFTMDSVWNEGNYYVNLLLCYCLFSF